MRVAFLKKAKPLKECFKILRTLTPDNALRVAKVLCTFLLKNDPRGGFSKTPRPCRHSRKNRKPHRKSFGQAFSKACGAKGEYP